MTTLAPRRPVGPTPAPLPGIRARMRGRLRSLLVGHGAIVWERPAFLGLLASTAVLYFWNLTASGWANSFYSAAAQAGSVNWEAFFYGSSDASNAITVDKPPMSLWFMALSVRIFGLSSFSILLPEVLMGVATVAVLSLAVRRRFAAQTALLAGAALALTPVAALMFRFNNPDALLVLLLTLAAYFTIRALENGRMRWVLLAGTMVGFGFLTKQLQAFLVLPALAAAILMAEPRRLRTRLWHSLAGLGAVVVSCGWWVAVVELVPASWRPYIGGSQNNDFLELTFGYNGFGRITGSETGSVTGGASSWGATGITRLLDGDIGAQIAWLIPAALVLLAFGIAVLWRAPRTSVRRGMLVIFGGWMLVTGLAFSYMAGIFHSYYTVALAPAIAAVVAIGAQLLWDRRSLLWARIVAATAMAVTSIWAWTLLDRAADWVPALKWLVLLLGLGATLAMLLPPRGGVVGARVTAGLALTAALLAPTAYTLQTVSTAHTGSIPTAGPSVSGSGFGGGGGGGRGGFGGGQGGPGSSQGTNGGTGTTGTTGSTQGGFGGPGSASGGSPSTTGGTSTGSSTGTSVGSSTGTSAGTTSRGGGIGSLLGSSSVSSQLAALLERDASKYTWVAAAVGSDSAAGYQLATQDPVMAVGGFNGSDPAPTLAQFEKDVAEGKIHYFIGGTIGASNGGSSDSSKIAAWVAAHFTATTVDGVTLYDLTASSSASAS